jgi:UDP-3-O-[3-hydroxymyristoyl] glucosamine N-acyltransferase
LTTLLDKKSVYVAVSYETATYNDLKYFLEQDGIELLRQDPDEFTSHYNPDANYINLVTMVVEQRKTISRLLDERNLARFSYVHKTSTNLGQVESGCFVYPSSVIYAGAVVKKDTIIHSMTVVAHNVTVGTGTYISGGVLIGGGTTLGQFNQYMLGVIIHDKITICDHVVIGSNTVIRKDISTPGTYSGKSNTVRKIK